MSQPTIQIQLSPPRQNVHADQTAISSPARTARNGHGIQYFASVAEEENIRPFNSISGLVIVNTSFPIRQTAIAIRLWGESRVYVLRSSESKNQTTGSSSTTYRHYRDKANLFDISQDISPKVDELLPGITHAFDFEITFPGRTTCDRSQVYLAPEDSTWVTQPHTLPPSFSYASLTSRNDPPGCSITYGLTASLLAPGTSVDTSLSLIFLPHSRTGPSQYIEYMPAFKKFSLSSSTLAGQDYASMGFRQRIRDHLSHDTPKLDFEMTVEFPCVMRVGQEFGIKTTYTTLNTSRNVTKIQPIMIRIIKLSLLTTTSMRAPRDWERREPQHYKQDHFKYLMEQTEIAEAVTLLNTAPFSTTLELAHIKSEKSDQATQAKQCETWFRGRVPAFITPNFESYAIASAHRLKVKMEVEIGGKVFEIKTEGPNVLMEVD